jgi:superfamily I DNA/RNA helicase
MTRKQPTTIPAAIVAAYPDRQWSDYQQAIFAHVADSASGSAIVQATAGAGKSTTIIAATLCAPEGSDHIVLVFNKSVSEELKGKGVNARTFHSLTYSPVMKAMGLRTVESNKLRNLVREWSRDLARDYGTAACKLVGLARNEGIGAIVADTDQAWLALIERHEVQPDTDEGTEMGMVHAARRLLDESNAAKCVDFDDLIYLPVRNAIPLPRYALVFIDESQDLCPSQIALLRKIVKPGGRIVAVGDSNQAIYGFRGADADSMRRVREAFDCKPLPLTITYRCAASVVRYASQFGHVEAAPNAPEGDVRSLNEWRMADLAPDDSLVLCRTNAPLLKLAYKLMAARIPCHVMGRDIGTGLTSLINKLQPKGIDGLREKLAAWCDREVSKAQQRDNEALAASVQDKHDCIATLIDALPENERTVPSLCRLIDTMFSGTAGITLSSIHKAKGLEAGTVFWINRASCPSKWAKQPWAIDTERCLCFVAATRAKKSLIMLELENLVG